MDKPVINVALLQLTSCRLDQNAAMQKGEAFCRQATKQGADLIVFPEMWNISYDLSYLENGTEYLTEWREHAIDAESSFIRFFQKLAEELSVAIAISYLERVANGVRSTVSIIDRFGKIVMTYAKTHLATFEREALVAGESYEVSDLDTKAGNVKVGVLICYDMVFPETARILRLLGAELILIPLADGINSHKHALLRTRAYDNQVGVAMTNFYHSDPREANGRSVAFDGIAYNENGAEREMQVASAEAGECMTMARFAIGELREYRTNESGPIEHRRPGTYQSLVRV